jgi:hypothetical protein
VVTIDTAKKLLLEKKSFWSGLEGRMLTGQGLPGRLIGLRPATTVASIGSEQIPLGGDILLSATPSPAWRRARRSR